MINLAVTSLQVNGMYSQIARTPDSGFGLIRHRNLHLSFPNACFKCAVFM